MICEARTSTGPRYLEAAYTIFVSYCINSYRLHALYHLRRLNALKPLCKLLNGGKGFSRLIEMGRVPAGLQNTVSIGE